MKMFEERLKFKSALYELYEICKSHPTCASCYCTDYCDLLEMHNFYTVAQEITKKGNGDE